MAWLLEKLGVFLDYIQGARQTTEYDGKVAHRKVTLRPDYADHDMEIGVEISQSTFKTTFSRWWRVSDVHTVFKVVAFAPEEHRARLDARLFEPMYYPMLCNGLLLGTRYPHLYALHAFLDRVTESHPSIKCEL